ncbi:phage tail tip lysozyme [Streptococcus equi]|uniref:Putative conjugal transfer protein n=1 Tax=Streptococcus equi subsp. zooepidemicus TaxID=40041 RepID=A0A7Z9D1V1_STRSZ|nr:phage tail tip lysozyme [Streptococcus equi]MCD3401586.1 CHAP domain-containing protein [Streptococcus equi subsp. zooepidemicus]VEF04884.1 putative conjugal transfer protein [Streptococcus equi subsp. zooepidemicus]HEL0020200.1 CHAP domain-containing protein [Streptococcus equi subsp. zooepidemicus]HEL0709929.1 CHAP domain-containing protein [Streptococcus equi subsp. zooepidemicus]HEL0712065.1 CHAP domain-containing protein [Streptococcus equi subsp. zooepidemicus]
MSRQTRRDLRDAKRKYKEAKSDLKTTKTSYTQAEKREARLLNPKTDAEKRYLGQKQKARRTITSKELSTLKENKKNAKAKKNQAIQRNGGTNLQKVGRVAHHQASTFVDSSFQDNDILEDIVSARQTIKRTHAEVRRAKWIGSYSVKVGKGVTKAVYGTGNRTYNLARGRGFTRTATNARWETKVKNKYQRLRSRFRASKAGKTAHRTKQVASKISKPILAILKNPLSTKAYLIMFIGFLLLALLGVVTGGGSSTVSQNEFDLTDTWTYLSKIDREKSNDKVDYWTNIDEIMMFMGYKHEDFKLDSKYDEKDKKWYEIKHTYRELLSDIWQRLNDDKDNLKTMADIYTSTDNKYLKLSKKDLTNYNEILEQAKQVGYYITYNDLDNPFTNEVNDEVLDPLVVIKRFGYVSKDKMYNGSILQASKGAALYAVMDGKISIKDSDLIIKSKTAEFTYKNVSRLRVKNGDKIKVGTEIGAVSSDNGQEVYYKKLKNKKKNEWVWVNVGFYLPNVEYNQTTSVLTDMNIKGDIAKKISFIYNYLKKQDSKITQNGVAAMLGNFWTESSITEKRAEGDYLNPPIGASASSWDDENWLSMNGPAIYNGAYPNILRRGLGLGQWTDTGDGSTRHTALLNFAKSKNKKWYDLELQLDFMLHGDSPYYIKILNEILHSNDDVPTLAKRFLNFWEGNAGDKLKERQNNAEQVLAFLKNPSGGAKGGSSTLQSSWGFPSAYRSKLKSYPSSATVSASLGGNTYPVGQCTWYVYNRLVEAGSPAYNWLGNGQDWVRNLVAKGWKFSNTPVAGAVMSTQGGFDYTYPEYGHVSYVEYVNEDGTFLVSECNINRIQNQIHWSVKSNAPYYTFAIPPK